MARPEQYQQEALTFQRPEPQSAQPQTVRPTEAQARPEHPRYPTHDELMESRYREGLWAEYRFECENRERLDLPAVSMDEFKDMRDWSAGNLEPADAAWSNVPDRPPYERRLAPSQDELE